MERLVDPQILNSLSLGERISEALLVILLGVSVVFTVLVVLMVCIRILSAIFQK